MELLRLAFTLFVGSSIVLAVRYQRRQAIFRENNAQHDAKRLPPTYPYVLPWLGSLPFAYLWNPKSFVLNPKSVFQASRLVRVKVPTSELFIIQGPENIKAMFRNSAACTSIPFVKFAVERAFGLPKRAAKLYDLDDSGGGPVPHPDSTIESRNRIDYRTHQSLSRFLVGERMSPFWNRFASNATNRFHDLFRHIGSEGQGYDDLMQLVGDEVMISFLDAMCGPHLLRLCPEFLEDFWEFDHHLPTYLQGTPWLFARKAYACRARALDAVKKWQKHARESYTDAALDTAGDDPFWGTKFFRERQGMFLEMDGFDHDAVASEDFGAIWAARNSLSATSWTVYELFRDRVLLSKVRSEVDDCVLSNSQGSIQFDIDKLLRLPLLQSVYAETLRLRMHFYLIRMPDRVELAIKDWIIPRQKIVITSTTAAHMDHKAWDTGLGNDHPLDTFWGERFLTFANGTGKPTFSVKEVEGSWIPYGGGPRQCPGRHFAKRQILLSTALMITLFDCEFLEPGVEVKEDLRNFGMGVAQPASKVPVELYRRDRSWCST